MPRTNTCTDQWFINQRRFNTNVAIIGPVVDLNFNEGDSEMGKGKKEGDLLLILNSFVF